MKKQRKILIIVENLTMPIDRRVWQEAKTLRDEGYLVSIICPVGGKYTKKYELLDGIHVYRHPLPLEAEGAKGYLVEYSSALIFEFLLSIKVLFKTGFDVIQACNPPDTIFLIGGFYKLFGKKFIFDHHDINPELYEAKFNKKGFFYKLLLLFEKLTFKCADVSIATNENFKDIAIKRGGMISDNVYVVRSFPDLTKFKRIKPNESLKNDRESLIGYVGILGAQDGVDILIDAICEIVHVKGRDDIHCAIVGNGTELKKLKQHAIKCQVDKYITFTGYCSGDDLLSAYSTFDVGVIPDPKNPYNDKISMNKVFEYMVMGIPFVQFDLKEGKSFAGDAALCATDNNFKDLADKLIQLIDTPELAKELGNNGLKRAESDISWEKEKTKLLAAYEAVLG
jgi:glycosyltransferase involved in cell wall biosynthesis